MTIVETQPQTNGQIAHPAGGASPRYPVPTDAALGGEYTLAPDLEKLARALIREHGHRVAAECQITYLWRKKGGAAKGKPTLGACSKPSGLLRHFAGVDFVIWLAADHLRDDRATVRQVSAALWHELGHVGETEEPANADEHWMPELTLLSHDFEGFLDEYQRYGAWRADLRAAEHAFRQLPLDLASGRAEGDA